MDMKTMFLITTSSFHNSLYPVHSFSTINKHAHAVNNFDVDFFCLANFDSCFAGNYLGNDLVCLALKRKFDNEITKNKC